ncbi:MAG: hypothetical protein KDA32_01865 [Phycisphaerales bacterium]|nr:hypothetical protein [Phycisphaerales bacterium]
MKMLVACRFPERALADLRSLGSEVVYEPAVSAEDLGKHLRDVAILIIGRTRVAADAIDAAPDLQMIVKGGSDISTIAVEEASRLGVFVSSSPGRDSVAIAEYALTLALALDRSLGARQEAARAAERPEQAPAHGLQGRTLGILPIDGAGRELARRARAFGMRVLAWAPTVDADAPVVRDVEMCAWPTELAQQSDILVSVARPGAWQEVLANADVIDNLPSGGSFIHIGHPGAFSEDTLATAVRHRGVRAALDLWLSEYRSDAIRFKTDLLDLPGVIYTRGAAGGTEQAREAIAEEVVRIVRRFLVSGEVVNCVNLLERSPATWQLVLRLRDTVGVMAAIMDAIQDDGINAEEILSRVFVGAKAAWCTISLTERPSTDALDTIRGIDGVIHMELRAVV